MSVSRTLSALALAIAMAVAGAVPANAIADGRNVSPGVHSTSLVRLHIGDMSCAGTLITPEWALTARHCIGEGDVARATIGATINSPEHRITEAITHPTADLAVVKLASPSGAATSNLNGAHLQPGVWANPVGWGGWNQNNLYLGQQADAQVQRRVVNLPSPDRTAQMIEATISNGRLLPGDSGGPLFVNGEVAGVLSMSTAADLPSQHGTMGWYVPVAEHLDWISRHTGKWVPAAAGSPSPLVDASVHLSEIPPVVIQNIPASGNSLIDGTLRSMMVGSS